MAYTGSRCLCVFDLRIAKCRYKRDRSITPSEKGSLSLYLARNRLKAKMRVSSLQEASAGEETKYDRTYTHASDVQGYEAK